MILFLYRCPYLSLSFSLCISFYFFFFLFNALSFWLYGSFSRALSFFILFFYIFLFISLYILFFSNDIKLCTFFQKSHFSHFLHFFTLQEKMCYRLNFDVCITIFVFVYIILFIYIILSSFERLTGMKKINFHVQTHFFCKKYRLSLDLIFWIWSVFVLLFWQEQTPALRVT